MDLTEAMELFKEIRKRFKNHQSNFSEFRTRIMFIDPVLRLLGWEVENPDLVVLEYQPNTQNRKSADYVLKNNGKNVVIVEAKNIDINIEGWEHRDQADDYARYAEVKFFVLTNGVTWMLYERDLMTSLESLKPIVRFDIAHDKPYQCALAALSMWRPNLTAEEPVFISPKPVPDRSYSGSNKQQEQQPDDLPEDFDQWYSLASERRYPKYTIPIQLKIGADINEQVNSWKDVIHEIVTWLVNKDILKDNHCPIEIREKTFIGYEAVNRDGTPFKDPRQLPKGLMLQRGISTPLGQWERFRALLDQLKVDTSTIRVSHKPDVSVKRK